MEERQRDIDWAWAEHETYVRFAAPDLSLPPSPTRPHHTHTLSEWRAKLDEMKRQDEEEDGKMGLPT